VTLGVVQCVSRVYIPAAIRQGLSGVELKLYLWWRGMLGLGPRAEKGVKLETGVCLVAAGDWSIR
jgi:hypothetical protein